MTIASYRLETIAAGLIEQLEGRRRSYGDRPDEWAEAATRIADEVLDGVEGEYTEVMGPGDLPERLRREIHEIFLPRYIALSADHTALERRGYDAWRRGDPISRLALFLAALGLVTLAARLLPLGPTVLIGYVAALSTPFLPELRAFFYRRAYTRQLRGVLEDLERIQDQLDALPKASAGSPAEPERDRTARHPQPGAERDR